MFIYMISIALFFCFNNIITRGDKILIISKTIDIHIVLMKSNLHNS